MGVRVGCSYLGKRSRVVILITDCNLPCSHDAKRWFAASPKVVEPVHRRRRWFGVNSSLWKKTVPQNVGLRRRNYDLRRRTVLTLGIL